MQRNSDTHDTINQTGQEEAPRPAPMPDPDDLVRKRLDERTANVSKLDELSQKDDQA